MTPFNPMTNAQDDRFRLGVFSANADRGLSFTTVEEQWRAEWSEIADAARIADDGGIDFFLPIARWRGFGGRTNVRGRSFETFTFAAALASITKRMALFSTVHVPFIHPLYAAKALASVDQISGGRAGLNIVCGWNPDEFEMFGAKPDEFPYDRAKEWLDIIDRVYTSEDPIDFAGKFYSIKAGVTDPKPLQRPRPVTMNAAFGPPGREFAAANCDHIFTSFSELEAGRSHIKDISTRAAANDREVGVFTVGHVVCRPSQSEAEDYYDRYSRDQVDDEAVEFHVRQKAAFSNSHDDASFKLYKQRFAAGTGSYPLVGTPDRIAEELGKIADVGFSGVALSFVNYLQELPYFCETVVPAMREVRRTAA
ncbi:LLM class flavin-dependent oxidoreductase [Ensifer sp. ENS05]|uniref:LLM class flavin-dependent oxidoreductase n=1 Tax=Ensifer sp. ENS05 TaxID=2769277 RepID=UPI0017849BFB|nr:LLM class flavin-dependent oxidoreductase [Ensifer sp. ENS05]MBD9597397.1 LLM class flavin-dependent oxidoreductase [Ensifer sp. ENS05]